MKRFIFNNIVIVLCTAGIIHLLYSLSGPNVTETGFISRYNTSVFFPEGWGFFTKSPRGEKYMMYKVLSDGVLRPVHRKNGSIENWFGLSRTSRRVNMEIARLINVVKADSSWLEVIDKESTFPEIRFQSSQTDTIGFDAKQYHFITTGTYILKRYRVPAWSWARHPEHFTKKAFLKKVVLR